MKSKISSATASMSFVAKLFISKTPFKVIAECLLSTIKNVLVVINAVWLLECLTDMILAGKPFSETIKVLVFVVVLNILVSIVQNFYDYYLKPQNDLKIKQYLDKHLMEHAEKLSLNNYENSEFYTIVKQAQSATSVTVYSAYSDLVQVIGNVAALISAVVVAVTISPGLLVFIGFTIPMVSVSQKYGQLLSEKKMELAFWERKMKYAKDAWMSKNLARIFRITNAWKIIDKHYEEGYEGSQKMHKAYGSCLMGWNLLGTECSITLIMIACYAYGIMASVYSSGFSASGFSVMFVAVMNMVSRIRKIYKSYENLCSYNVQLKTLQSFERMEPEAEMQDGLIPGKFESLEFRHVWFSYDGVHWALKDVSFRIESGEKISIFGYNGAGKSTLIKLLLRFYPVSLGEILYNGVNVNKYRLAEYRKVFSAAFQDYKLFSVSLAENIWMKECTEKQKEIVRDTLMQMGKEELAQDTLRILGREYDGEGVVLSGGQQQWLTVARLNFEPFEIAVLDEPSAALDPIASKQMQEELLRLVDNRSMLMVSHDMSVANCVDRLLFFDAGELVAQGTHGELMKQNQKYAAFYECQAKNYRG